MSNVVTNETTKVVTKVVDVRHKAPDQAIHELMQAAKDGFAVTKIATRFNHTHVYLEASSKQVSTKLVGEASTKQVSKTDDNIDQKTFNETVDKLVEKELVDKGVGEKAKTTAKKTTSKTNTTKKVEPEAKDSE